MNTLEACPALAQRHRAALEDAERAAASALAIAQLGRLRGTGPAQPMPPGAYECWATSAGLSIVHIGRPGVSGERAITQVWPPLPATHAAPAPCITGPVPLCRRGNVQQPSPRRRYLDKAGR
jgi:hypothetical protein